jgi:hypothetical protein
VKIRIFRGIEQQHVASACGHFVIQQLQRIWTQAIVCILKQAHIAAGMLYAISSGLHLALVALMENPDSRPIYQRISVADCSALIGGAIVDDDIIVFGMI